MSALSIQVPFPVFQGRDGQPLENGYVWIGEPNLNPQTNPVVVYFDEALTIPAAQPLRTLNGYVSRAGTPAQLYVDGVNFSILVQDSKGSMVYNFPDGTGIGAQASGVSFTGFKGQVGFVQDLADDDGSDWIGFDAAAATAVARSAQDKMRDIVSVKDFGAVANDVDDDAPAFNDALQYLVQIGGGALFVPSGKYRIKSRISVICDAQQHISIYGEGRYVSTLDFSTASDLGLNFQSTSIIANQLPTFEVTSLGLITSHQEAGSAINVDFASDQNLDGSVYFADLLIAQNIDRSSDSGSGYGYWTTGIECTNARNGEIRNVHAYGEMQVSPNSAFGVLIDGESTAFVISDSLFLEFTTGVKAEGTSEGLYLNNTDIVYCRYGAYHTSSVGTQPQFTAVGCSFNCANAGVWLNNIQQSVVADSLFYAASVLDTGTWPEWKGVLIDGSLSAFNKVIGCTFTKEIQRTGDITTGIDFNQGAAFSSTGNHFFGFSGNALTYGVQVRSGVSNVKIGDDHIFSFVTNNVANAGTTASFYQPVIQAGSATVTSGDTVTFPSTFNTNPNVIAVHDGTNTAANVTVGSITSTNFRIYHNAGGSILVQWIATGY
jgi:hypothetical protein